MKLDEFRLDPADSGYKTEDVGLLLLSPDLLIAARKTFDDSRE